MNGIPLRNLGGSNFQFVPLPGSGSGLLWEQASRIEDTTVAPEFDSDLVVIDMADIAASNFISLVLNVTAQQPGPGVSGGSGTTQGMVTWLLGKDSAGLLQKVNDVGDMFLAEFGEPPGSPGDGFINGDNFTIEWQNPPGIECVVHYVVQVYAAQMPFDMNERQ